MSTSTTVVLDRVSSGAEGTVSCEASVISRPSFQAKKGALKLMVVRLPDSRPPGILNLVVVKCRTITKVIEVRWIKREKRRYKVGERLELECLSRADQRLMRPWPNITWYLDGQKVAKSIYVNPQHKITISIYFNLSGGARVRLLSG